MKTTLILLSFSLSIPFSFVRAEAVEDLLGSAIILHDPFQKPVFLQPSFKPKMADKQPGELSWTPHLLMTLRAGKNSMANIGGQLIRLGEVIDGHKLIEVYERAVVFVNQGEITRLTLDEDNEDNEDKAMHEAL